MSLKSFFSYKAILNRNIKGHELTESEIKSLQRCLITISSEIIEVCEKYNLKLILQGGTLLGYIRHNGFIPWDDDIDFGMLREDYEKFISIFNKELSDRFILSAPKKGFSSYNRFIQVFRKETYIDDGGLETTNRPKNISIDIFPLDFAPNKSVIRNIKGLKANVFMAIGGAVDTRCSMNKEIKKIMCSSLSGTVQYCIRMLIGFLFSFNSPKKWFEIIDKAIACSKPSEFITSGTGRKHYLGEVVQASAIIPLEKTTFEGLSVYRPNKPDVYLQNLYGDYMQIPSPEKREKHFAVNVKTL